MEYETRICKLGSCDVGFIPRFSNQYYCSAEHRTRSATEIRTDTYRLGREARTQRIEIR